jgi:DnaJ family protein C protein 17
MSDPPDYYAILNVSSSATKEEITKAYRKRVFQVHPDKNPDLPNAKNLFNDVQKAYEVLSDEKAKEAYDALLKAKASRLKREREMDEKRKKMKEDLLARERVRSTNALLSLFLILPSLAPHVFTFEQEAKKQKTEEERARKLYEAELDRLRREGWSKLREQYAQQQQQQQQQQKMRYRLLLCNTYSITILSLVSYSLLVAVLLTQKTHLHPPNLFLVPP